jgi:hypothetical protein
MIFIKRYKSNVSNATKTLKKSVGIKYLIERINDPDIIAKLSKFQSSRELNFWDLGVKAKKHLIKDAILVIICKKDVYVGKILDIIYDPDGKIGDALQWARSFKAPWSNVILLNNLKIQLDCRESMIINFIKDRPDGQNIIKLQKDFFGVSGNLEGEFIDTLRRNGLLEAKVSLGSQEPTRPKGRMGPPELLKKHIVSVEQLKGDPHHSERGHESLVEEFFVFLGYERHSDIKYRVGRLDILIALNKNPVIVVEVKKYWDLTYSDENVVEQAYNYANKIGARYVVITNGDYYSIFDRDKGRSYESNLVGAFQLSKLEKEDLKQIDFLRKDNIIHSYNLE